MRNGVHSPPQELLEAMGGGEFDKAGVEATMAVLKQRDTVRSSRRTSRRRCLRKLCSHLSSPPSLHTNTPSLHTPLRATSLRCRRSTAPSSASETSSWRDPSCRRRPSARAASWRWSASLTWMGLRWPRAGHARKAAEGVRGLSGRNVAWLRRVVHAWVHGHVRMDHGLK